MISPDDPRHGKRAGYLAGCREDDCATANRRYMKKYRLRSLENGGRTTVPRDRAREHIERLSGWMSLSAIASAAGTGSSEICRILSGKHPRIKKETEARILALSLSSNPGPSRWLHALPASRRIQALIAYGYTYEQISEHTGGYGKSNLRLIAIGARGYVTFAVDQQIRKAYNHLQMQPIPEPANAWLAGSLAKRRKKAAARGWVPPWCWDEDAIDDPAAVPAGTPRCDGDRDPIEGIDEGAIQRRIDGDREIRLHAGEAAELTRRLLAAGWSKKRIYVLTGVEPNRYKGEVA